MKLELFDFVEDTLKIIADNKEELVMASRELRDFFTAHFETHDDFLNVSRRIKSENSLREKILRMNYYTKYGRPENLIKDLSDLIGLRLECRFIEDEAKMFERIKALFDVKGLDGMYFSDENPSIALYLDEPQPMLQKNGFEIYKIDGVYFKDNKEFRFELQLKSLVNIFWGEIDHRVLYKNFNYILKEHFVKDIMYSIKESLYMIDRQLMLVFNHLNSMNPNTSAESKIELESLLSKSIYDIYIEKVRREMGFVIDFKNSTDVIVRYLFMKDINKDRDYGDNFLRLLNRLTELEDKSIKFNEYINFERELHFPDSFTRQIGYKILSVINKDFTWNLFFKIIFDIENGSNADDFEGFMIFLRYRFNAGIVNSLNDEIFRQDQISEIQYFVLEQVVESFGKDIDIRFITDHSLDSLNNKIHIFLNGLNNFQEWMGRRNELRNIILNHQYKDY